MLLLLLLLLLLMLCAAFGRSIILFSLPLLLLLKVVPLATQVEIARVAAEAQRTKRKLTADEKKQRALKRNLFMVCTAAKLVNEAVRRHREVHCTAN